MQQRQTSDALVTPVRVVTSLCPAHLRRSKALRKCQRLVKSFVRELDNQETKWLRKRKSNCGIEAVGGECTNYGRWCVFRAVSKLLILRPVPRNKFHALHQPQVGSEQFSGEDDLT